MYQTVLGHLKQWGLNVPALAGTFRSDEVICPRSFSLNVP
jgi:hypothetical protein